ncbi:hypothetical protein OG206_15290 [Streptomyces sp. NBC_01341]|uniref:hypothetical protein n=1 Tax=Streptomyces sp. NBC_01341 TaxID=2903831 RepID=UPI002E0E20ED|nr:hypothetical protein OG206_15290 [Streptomyces sp. NBC_01341]
MHQDPSDPLVQAPVRIPSQGPDGAHTTTTVERGSFCLARCACGWTGPARRSRDRARTDAAEHLTAAESR